jgi:hypothetical protein
MQRQRSKPHTLKEQIEAAKKRLEVAGLRLPPGLLRSKLERKIRHLEAASLMNDWLASPGLRSPM